MSDMVEDFDEFDADSDAGAEIGGSESAPAAAASVMTESASAAEKRRLREQLEADMEAFLKRGGQVQTVAENVRADPPRKPDIQYGSAPI